MPPLVLELLKILSPFIIAKLKQALGKSKSYKEFKKNLEKRGVPKFLIDNVFAEIFKYIEFEEFHSAVMTASRKGKKTAKKATKRAVKKVSKKVVKKAKKKTAKKVVKKKAVKKVVKKAKKKASKKR